ncbi:hypothetical protein GDO81_000744 [Engystomops pustulosus]|uniref:Eukaryotic translation initiation factor 4E n=1 Tax=Engystomops pustulosus TaxID=76066 RepID=A0AAV7D6X3_ENGPU|nr:hypothetical protein GDO81_000744 [Engystomops pustulosus]
MATVEPETVIAQEEEKTETSQEIVNPEHYIKHPLQNRWALWFFKNDKSKTWQANLRLISKFDTVEDFWALYNHIQLSSNLMSGCDYSLFKDGIEPMWEDEKNKRGGRWLITLNKQQRRNDLDRFWLETVGVASFTPNTCLNATFINPVLPWSRESPLDPERQNK